MPQDETQRERPAAEAGATAASEPAPAAAAPVPPWPELPEQRAVSVGKGSALFDLHALVYRLFHAQRRYLFRNDKVELGVGQPKILTYLAVYGKATQRQVAQYFSLDPAAISRMIEALKRGGYIEAAPHARDRRAKEIELTARGREAVAAWDAACVDLEKAACAGFTDEERATFKALLARAYGNLLDAASEGSERHGRA